MLKDIKKYISFLKNISLGCQKNSLVFKISHSLKLWLFQTCLSILVMVIVHSRRVEPLRTDLELSNENILTVFFIVVLLAPILEEIAFRLFLSGKAIHFVVSFSMLTLYLNITLNSIWKVLIIFCFGFVLCLFLLRFIHFEKFQYYFSRNFKAFFYLSAIAFGVAHVSVVDIKYFYEYFLITVDFTLAGLLFGYLRVNFGFWWGVFLHCFNNLFVFLVLLVDFLYQTN